MTSSYYVIGAVLLYFVALTVVSYVTGKKHNNAQFISGGYKIPALGTFSSLFVSTIDGVGLVFLVTLAASIGFGLYWFAIGIFLTALLFCIQAPRIRKLSEEKKFLNITDLLKSQLGTVTAGLAVIIVTILIAAHSASLLYICGQIFSAIFGSTLTVSIIVTSVVVGGYIYFGGYKAVIATDIVQFLAIILLLGASLFIVDFPSVSFAQHSFLMNDSLSGVFGIIVFSLIMFYTVPAIWQRIFTSQDLRSTKKSLLLFGLAYVPVYFVIIVLALTLFSMFSTIDPSQLLYTLSSGQASPFLGVILSVSLLALTMSSLDTQVYIFLSTIASNWLKIDKESNSEKYVSVLKVLIAISFILMTVIALTISNVVSFVLSAFSLLSVLAPALFVAVYSEKESRVLDYSMATVTIFGIAVFFYMMANAMFVDLFTSAIPGLATIIVTFVGWLAWELFDLEGN
ncbi:MAG: hypothetical protein K9M10_02730 [Candidatus Pacebacteria bacterium]|nr:hypothetical protein [Candidatus Paceibacterota bacterium]MCF7857369.1 hypothetical protein [Candidatus Paceibacterota bacterium]